MLGPSQLKTLHSLMDRIIPRDDYPGASEAGVGDYLTRQLNRDLRQYVELYRAGLEALEAEATASAGQSFAALPTTAQDVLLHRLEDGDVLLAWPIDPVQFFQTVTRHVVEGYYSDPGNGGNRDRIAWQMIGFTGDSLGGDIPGLRAIDRL